VQLANVYACFQNIQQPKDCVVVVKDKREAGGLFYMSIGSSKSPVLSQLLSPPLPLDALLLWCEEQEHDRMSLVFVTLCGNMRCATLMNVVLEI
jgi:hypothetical protein